MNHAVKPKVDLIRCTADPDALAGEAAAICYNGKNPVKSLQIALGNGHESTIEHVSFTFRISGVSRAFLAQITRHRLASFSVESQRYVPLEDGFEYIIPPAIEVLGAEDAALYARQMEFMRAWYEGWKAKGIISEDARMVLPNACGTRMIVTMDARELRHFFTLRLCERAQWEIRAVAREMYAICKETAPMIFENAGPACMRGPCPEGKMSCGHPWANCENRGAGK